MKEKIDIILSNFKNNLINGEEAYQQILAAFTVDEFFVEDWLGEEKDIWHHPIVSDRTDKKSYGVAELILEFNNYLLKNENRSK
jgi:hypothetical protein